MTRIRTQHSQEWYPHQIFQKSPYYALLTQSVLQERVAEISEAEKHDGCGQPDLEAVHVETIDRKLKTEQKVVQERERKRDGNSIFKQSSMSHTMGTE